MYKIRLPVACLRGRLSPTPIGRVKTLTIYKYLYYNESRGFEIARFNRHLL